MVLITIITVRLYDINSIKNIVYFFPRRNKLKTKNSFFFRKEKANYNISY